jgi:MFS family permease
VRLRALNENMAAPIPITRSAFARFPVYYGWVNVVIASIAMVTTLAGNDQGLGLITESLLKDLQIDKVSWSTINLCATLIGALFVFPTGRLIDRFGSRAVLAAILIPLGVTVIGMSRATSVGQLWVTAIITSVLGQSALSVASMALVGKWFVRRITLAMGVYSILVVIGYIVAFLLFGPAIAKHGWRGPWQSFGCVILFGIAPVSWLAVRASPEAVGVSGDFKSASESEVSSTTWNGALRTQAFWCFGLSSAIFGMLIGGIMLFYESILRERGFDARVRDLVLGLQTLAGLFASFVGGWAGLRWSLGKLLAIAMALLAGALVLLANVSSMTGVIVYATAMGIAGALVTVIFFSIWGHAFGRVHLGKIQGMAQGLCIVSGAFGPRILAQVQEGRGSYVPAFYAFAVLSAGLGAWAWFVPIPRADGGHL